jgi:hypothetical protein
MSMPVPRLHVFGMRYHQRTAINKQAKEKQNAEINAILNPRPIVPPVRVDNQRAAQGFLGRVLAGIRGH